MRARKKTLGLLACLVIGAQGCMGAAPSPTPLETEDTDLLFAQRVEPAELQRAPTDDLVAALADVPGGAVVIFDFDDTLLDHVDGGDSRFASYAARGVAYLKKHGVPIAICSQNRNTGGGLNRRLRRLDSEVFNDAFFASPAFQTGTGSDKLDDVREIMAHFGIRREDHVLFFDDNPRNIERIGGSSDAVAVPVGDNGIDRNEFRAGVIELLAKTARGGDDTGGGAPGRACGEGVSARDFCRVCGNCQQGEGDCDSDSECAPGLVCVSAADGGDKDQPGHDICVAPADGGPASCAGQCSRACPCQEGQGDCDTSDDCAGDLVCPPDGPGAEQCRRPGSQPPPPPPPARCAGQCSRSCPCQEGEGDCDTSDDCAGDLVCPPDRQGAEQCQRPGSDTSPPRSGSGNLRVRVGNRWVSVGCDSGSPRANGSDDRWVIVDRKLRNQDGVFLFCDEGWPDGKDCQCSRGNSEAYHAITQADFNVASSARRNGNGLTDRLARLGPMYIFPNNGHEFCLALGANNIIENKDGGDDRSHHESTHAGRCTEWCMGAGCP